jgi:hypothetical protein
MKTNNERRMPKNMVYQLLLVIQIFGTMIFIWQQIPEFNQLLLNPGEQLPKDFYSELIIFGILCMMQISFLVPGIACANTVSTSQHFPQSPFFIFRTPQFYFWWLFVRCRRFQASS